MATRGFTEKDFMLVAGLIHDGVRITQEAKKLVSSPKLQNFLKFITSPDFPSRDHVIIIFFVKRSANGMFPLK